MMRIARVISSALVAVLILLSAGCQRIPLYDRATRVDILIDLKLGLSHKIEMSVDRPLEKVYQEKIDGVAPQYYEALIYDSQTNKLLSSHILGEKGGTISVPPGKYHIVAYSFGTESTQTDHLDNRLNANAFTTDITQSKAPIIKSQADSAGTKSSSKAYEDDPIIHEPDHLYVASKNDVEIEAFTYDEDYVVVLNATASSILDVYSLEVVNIQGVKNIEKVEAFVTGQILSNYFGRGDRDTSPATLYVNMSTDPENERLYTVFNTFGKLPGAENKIFLDITVTDSGGGQYRYIYDVTDQFDNPDNKNNRLIIDGGDINIPDAKHGGGGFAPEVDEWENEVIDVPLI